jgi:hypothetical protein
MMPSEIKVGMRAIVMSLPDKDCERCLVWGHGVVNYTEERTEVYFDDGSGGMWPHAWIYPEPKTWADVGYWLRLVGWEIRPVPVPASGLPQLLWRAPDGISAHDFRSDSPDAPPEAVMEYAFRRGDIGFVCLGAGATP